jgi:hypothetical protein
LDYKENPKEIGLDDYFTLDPDNFDVLAENDLYECTGINYLAGENGLIGDESDIPWKIMSDGMAKSISSYTDFYQPGNFYDTYIENSCKSTKLNLNGNYKLNENHSLYASINYQKYDIKTYQKTSPWILDEYIYNRYLEENAIPADSVYNSQYQI